MDKLLACVETSPITWWKEIGDVCTQANKLLEKISLFIEKHKDVEDKGLQWEMIKIEIRMFKIYYSKQKAKARKNYEENLLQEAQRLQKLVENRTTPEAIKEYDSKGPMVRIW